MVWIASMLRFLPLWRGFRFLLLSFIVILVQLSVLVVVPLFLVPLLLLLLPKPSDSICFSHGLVYRILGSCLFVSQRLKLAKKGVVGRVVSIAHQFIVLYMKFATAPVSNACINSPLILTLKHDISLVFDEHRY